MEETGGAYSSVVPSQWLFDLSMQKGLWERRLRLSFTIRNAFNHTDRTHPIGAEFDLTLWVQAQVVLGSAVGADGAAGRSEASGDGLSERLSPYAGY